MNVVEGRKDLNFLPDGCELDPLTTHRNNENVSLNHYREEYFFPEFICFDHEPYQNEGILSLKENTLKIMQKGNVLDESHF